YSMHAMAADVLAFLTDQGVTDPVIIGHSMGGRVTMNTVIAAPDVPRAVVLVDVGPELSGPGVKIIGDFVVNNVEFDDLDVFLDNVVRYDRFRSREHIARTVKYNLLQRADGKFVSKVDHRRLGGQMNELTLHDVQVIRCPVLVIRGGESDVLLADAAARFVDA